jgi:hypothetical protein
MGPAPQGQAQNTMTLEGFWAWGYWLPAFSHYCSLSRGTHLMEVNQGTFISATSRFGMFVKCPDFF